MKLFIKVVRGKGYIVDIPENSTVLNLKQNLENALKIPVTQQAILNAGKVLVDMKLISFYPTIKDGTKLFLIVKEPEPMEVVMRRFLQKYYTEDQSKKICEEFMKDFDHKVASFSVDERERIASLLIEDEKHVVGKDGN